MRTLTQITLAQLKTAENSDNEVRTWLDSRGFRPEPFSPSPELEESLRRSDAVDALASDLYTRKGVEILLSVPRFEDERSHVLRTARYVIHFDDPVHAATVWGLVSIDAPNVNVRWRHQITRSLELATEQLVREIITSSGEGGLFRPFPPKQNVPVREPRSTTDSYVGEILPPRERRKERAREAKKAEIRLAAWSFIATVVFMIAGGALFAYSTPNGWVRWLSGAFDRLATTAAATAVISYLNYLFYFHDLQRKSVIDWR